ncbi:MAG: hypothetical protein K2X66_01100, partial [Cyanobacteria bacterium]|nr:hypothetical protein [Cyanobacteriota bacterium]
TGSASIFTRVIRGKWGEVDSQRDVELYETLLQKNNSEYLTWGHDWRWEIDKISPISSIALNEVNHSY